MSDGVAGIALFLAQLYSVTRDAITKDTLYGALAQLDAFVAGTGLTNAPPGYFRGAAGLAATYFEVAKILLDDRYLNAGLSVLQRVVQAERHPSDYDVMAGTAGLIPVLLQAAVSTGEDGLIEAAVREGQILLAAAVQTDRGMSWPTPSQATHKHLLGYGFGASGIACALLEVYRVTGDQEFLDAGLAGLRYERSYYDEHRQGWPHLRTEAITPCGLAVGGPESDHPVAWCHGAPAALSGMLRSRELLASIGQPNHQEDELLEAAIKITLRVIHPDARSPLNFGLCHGQAGCADLLLQAADVLGRPELLEVAAAVGQFGIRQFHERREPWPCALQGFGECPSLMYGLSGIGHFYLRLHRPQSMRSALTLPDPSPTMQLSQTSGHR